MRYRSMRGMARTIVVLGVAACISGGLSASAGAHVATAQASSPVRIAVLLSSTENTYEQAQLKGATAAAAKYGGTISKVFNGNFDAATQAAQITDAVTAKAYDALLITPEAGNVIVPQVKAAVAAGLKVVCMLSTCGLNGQSTARQIPGYITTVGYQTAVNGTAIAQAVVMACGKLNPCNVVYEPGLFSFSAEQFRTNAFNAYLKKFPAIHVLAEQQGQYLAGPGRAAMQNMLEAHPNINVAASSGDQMTAGMYEAVKSAKDAGKIALIGNGASVPGVAAVAAGQWYATVANVPYTEGYLSAQYAIEAAKGTPLSKIPAFVNDLMDTGIGTAIITKANASKFKAQWAG